MNENPEGTPNPLNPNPAPVGQEANPGVTPMPVAVQPNEGPKGTIVEPVKKKKTGLIACLIAFFTVAIVCAIVAIIAFDPFGFRSGANDRVPKAIATLFSEGAPSNVEMNGKVSLYSNDESSSVAMLEINFDSELNVTSMANTTEATVTVTFADETGLSFKASEIHTEGGDLYLKLSGIPKAIDNYKNSIEVVDCEANGVDCITTDAKTSTNEQLTYINMLDSLGVLDVIDDEWILIPMNDFSNVTDLTELDTSTQCVIDALGTIGDYSNEFVDSYSNNQFITYSNEDLVIAKKQDELYRLGIDNKKFVGFINSLENTGFVNELNACVGNVAINTTVDEDDITSIVEALPTVYVEVNDKYQFTRVYLKTSSEDGAIEAVADIGLSYPTSITVTEPTSYIDINTVLSKVLTYFYDGIIPEE